jgi:hypothetical protein
MGGMRPPTSPAGPAGLTVLAVTAIAGIIFAVHGWSTRHSGLTPGAIGAATSSRAAAGPSAPARATSPAAPGPSASRHAASPAPSGSPKASSPGPKLSTQSYAQYSFRVWPGTPSAAAKAALTGLTVRVRREGSGLSVTAGVSGQHAAPRFYANGARVYVVEASMGDDSNNSDYSLGDDGLVVTDAQGRILQ